MKYISTRGKAPALSFKQAILAGLADDGGLYVPVEWPSLSAEQIQSFRCKPYTEVAFEVMSSFIDGEIPSEDIRFMIDEAYASFHHDATVPLVQTHHNEWVLEIFHGPTLAFKDVAMQILARMMDYVLSERRERLTIVGATSGDTGGAALKAFAGRDNIDIFFMFPHGKVSSVQQRQMTTLESKNTHAIAIKGNFDDCQKIVKNMFANEGFRRQINLSAVNSINWGRVMAQTVYYFTAAANIRTSNSNLSFTVPTGNFGDIYAGYVAKKLGLPIDRLVIATNENDILARTLHSGHYEIRDVSETITPSMDIQIASNFERLLFDACGRDSKQIEAMMHSLKKNASYKLSTQMQDAIKSDFESGSANQTETMATMKNVLDKSNYLLDPHTAVAINVARKHSKEYTPMVVLGTAHPAKFPETVQKATGIYPNLPSWSGDLLKQKEMFDVLDNDQSEIEAYIKTHSSVCT